MARRKSRDPEEDPSAALGEQLARLRTEAGFTTQQALAARFGLTTDVVAKAESGSQPPSPPVWEMWMDLCRVAESERKTLEAMLKIARKAKGPIPGYFEVYVNREKLAVFLRLWGLLLIPGPLQTYGYAHAMFMTTGMGEDQADAKANARVERGKVMDDPDAAYVTALIYEPVLSLQVGTPEVMVGQLERLLELSHQRNVVLQVVPACDYFPGLDGQFDIVSGPAIPDTVDIIAVKDHVSDDPDDVRTTAELFEEIRGYALSVTQSRALIQEALQRWKSQQQTQAGASPATATAQEPTA